MWESTVRLVGDDEAAHRALTQLKKAIRSRVTETELPEGSQLQLVSLTTSTVTAELEQLAAVSGDTDQQRRQQLLLAMLPVIQSAISRAVSEHAMKVQQEHEASTMRHRESLAELQARQEDAIDTMRRASVETATAIEMESLQGDVRVSEYNDEGKPVDVVTGQLRDDEVLDEERNARIVLPKYLRKRFCGATLGASLGRLQ